MYFISNFYTVLFSFLFIIFVKPYTKTSTTINTTITIQDGRFERYGVKAQPSKPKFFTYSVKPTQESNKIYANMSSECSSTSMSSSDVKNYSNFLCEIDKKSSAECTKSGSINPQGSDSICLVVFCNKSIGSDKCVVAVGVHINDALSVTVGTLPIPYLWPKVRVLGSGFGPNIAEYKASCQTEKGTTKNCSVATFIDSSTLEIKIGSVLLPGDGGALSVNLAYNGQNIESTQIGVVQFTEIKDYWTYIAVLILIAAPIIYFVSKKKAKKEEEKKEERWEERQLKIKEIDSQKQAGISHMQTTNTMMNKEVGGNLVVREADSQDNYFY